MNSDLYAMLGIPKDADARVIKRAFRTLAKVHHPDLNPNDPKAAEKFIEIATAFEILSNPDQRALYDEFGAQSLQDNFDPALARWRAQKDAEASQTSSGAGGSGWSSRYEASQSSFRSIFERVWEQHNPFNKEGEDDELYENVFVQPGEDLHHTLSISFSLAAKGGLSSILQPDGGTLTVRIPAGVEDGEELLVQGEGLPSEDPSGKAGDLWITLKVQQDSRYIREGLDLTVELPVTMPEAILGARIGVPTPHGECIMTLPQGVSSGAKLRLKEMGVHRGEKRGDLYVTIMIRSPDFIDSEIRAQIAKLERGYTKDVRQAIRDVDGQGHHGEG